MTIGERVAAWRRARGWSREQLADVMGLSRVSIWRIENDRQGPSAGQVALIAESMGLTVPEFYGEIEAVA